jgi:alginate O-acetyltransferase complex protein AlgI
MVPHGILSCGEPITVFFLHAIASGEILSVTCMFVFTMYGWLLFRATSFEQILGLSRSLLMVEEWQLRDSVPDLLRSAIYIAPMMVTEGVMAYFKAPNLSLRSDWKNAVVWCVVIYVTLFLASIDSETFIYFNF